MNGVDLFAGAGGWSLGFADATGRAPIVAVNHCEHAVRLHARNHPTTQHFLEDVRAVDPRAATVGTGGDTKRFAAFITTYYSGGGTSSRTDAPLPTECGDVAMRMLRPRELARAQGFPDSYVLEGSERDQIARIGNSVCPQVAAAIVRANTIKEAL